MHGADGFDEFFTQYGEVLDDIHLLDGGDVAVAIRRQIIQGFGGSREVTTGAYLAGRGAGGEYGEVRTQEEISVECLKVQCDGFKSAVGQCGETGSEGMGGLRVIWLRAVKYSGEKRQIIAVVAGFDILQGCERTGKGVERGVYGIAYIFAEGMSCTQNTASKVYR